MNATAAASAPPDAATAAVRVLLLGAHAYPHSPDLDNPALLRSAQALQAYFLGWLAADQVLWLFDSELPEPAQLEAIEAFLAPRPGLPALRDVVVCYVGHGDARGEHYSLALRSTRPTRQDFSLRVDALQRTLRASARNARLSYIVDACFSAAAARELMDGNAIKGGTATAAADGSDEAQRGVALLCASSDADVALAPAGALYTLFTGALLEALADATQGLPRLSLLDLRDAVASRVSVRPEVHSPDQRHGDVAAVRLFPVARGGVAGDYAARAEGVQDAFAPASFAMPDSLVALVVSVQPPAGSDADAAPPLLDYVRSALESYSDGILGAANHHRAATGCAAVQPVEGDNGIGGCVLAELAVERALRDRPALQAAIAALCHAEIAVFDITGFDAGVMFLLGVRAVARRGVTLVSVGGDYQVGGVLHVPFNLQLLNLSAHSLKQQRAGGEMQPASLIGHKLQQGFLDLAQLPHYLDTPSFDAVRQLGVASDAYRPVPPVDKVLVLCPFSADYAERNWGQYLDRNLRSRLKQTLLKPYPGAEPVIERLLDVRTPRLVAQTLFEAIRLTELCLIDWTGLRPNVMFEAGVRMAVNPLGAVHIVEHDEHDSPCLGAAVTPQVAGLLRLFEPVAYTCRPGVTEPYKRMTAAFEASQQANRQGELGFVYAAVGAAFDHRTQPVALPLVDDLLRQADLLESDDQESTGISPTLFHEVNRPLVAAARRAAAERRLAAWTYLNQRWTADEIAAEPHLSAQFDLLHALLRNWAGSERRQALLDDLALRRAVMRAARALLPPAKPDLASAAGAAGWVSRGVADAKRAKADALARRQEGDLAGAIATLKDTVDTLSAAREQLLGQGGSGSRGDRLLAEQLADCLGMLGGNLRRQGAFDEAMVCLRRGCDLEDAPRLALHSSYNLVNAVTLPLESGTRSVAEQRLALERAVKAIERQLMGPRRSSRWAWADIGQCQLLLGHEDLGLASYQRARDLGDAGTVATMTAALQRLREALARHGDAESVARIDTLLAALLPGTGAPAAAAG